MSKHHIEKLFIMEELNMHTGIFCETTDINIINIIEKINELIDAWNSLEKKEVENKNSYCRSDKFHTYIDYMKMNYEQDYSHTHCWKQEGTPACGIPLEKHVQCCLCDTKKPEKKCECAGKNGFDVPCHEHTCEFLDNVFHHTAQTEDWKKEVEKYVKKNIVDKDFTRVWFIDHVLQLFPSLLATTRKEEQERIKRVIENYKEKIEKLNIKNAQLRNGRDLILEGNSAIGALSDILSAIEK